MEDLDSCTIPDPVREPEIENPALSPCPVAPLGGPVTYSVLPATTTCGKLSCIGQNWTIVPGHLFKRYGPGVKRPGLSFNSIRSLEGINRFTSLEELILDNNNITDGISYPRLPKLHTLMLNKNKIKNLDQLLDQLQKCFPCLIYLSLLGNEACPNQLSDLDKDEEDYQRYRYYVLFHLPNLKFLDSTPVKMEEKLEAKRRGQYLKVIKPVEDVIVDKTDDLLVSRYTPLPKSTREQPDHKVVPGLNDFLSELPPVIYNHFVIHWPPSQAVRPAVNDLLADMTNNLQIVTKRKDTIELSTTTPQ